MTDLPIDAGTYRTTAGAGARRLPSSLANKPTYAQGRSRSRTLRRNYFATLFCSTGGLLLAASEGLAASGAAPEAASLRKPETLETVVVTGTRLNQTLSEAGTSISLLTAEDLERIGASFLVDALATAPGVTVNQTGAFGGLAALRIRGANQAQTLVLIDGVPGERRFCPWRRFRLCADRPGPRRAR